MNPLVALAEHGQSVWLDYISRSLLRSGELLQLIETDGLRGVTSNPSIFKKAIADTDDYATDLEKLRRHPEMTTEDIYERLALQDVGAAADILLPVYQDSGGADGYVSLEVSPRLAHDTGGTIDEAMRFWKVLDRPNAMIKVPATEEGLPAITALLAEGVNVNVTLLFARDMYERVARAYLDGVRRYAEAGGPARRVASVASFFVSRIDSAVDGEIAAMADNDNGDGGQPPYDLMGRVAIANARLAYQSYLNIFSGDRWRRLAAGGARPQRLLWASTSTKNPAYSEVLYVEELIGADTVNTMPPETLAAYRDQGRPAPRIADGVDDARRALARLAETGIDLDAITDKLLIDGVRSFTEAYDELLRAVKDARAAA